MLKLGINYYSDHFEPLCRTGAKVWPQNSALLKTVQFSEVWKCSGKNNVWVSTGKLEFRFGNIQTIKQKRLSPFSSCRQFLSRKSKWSMTAPVFQRLYSLLCATFHFFPSSNVPRLFCFILIMILSSSGLPTANSNSAAVSHLKLRRSLTTLGPRKTG